MPFQPKQNPLDLSIPSERIAGAYYRIQRNKHNISLSNLANQIQINKGFLSELENGKRHFPEGLSAQLDKVLGTNFNTDYKLYNQSRTYLFDIYENYFYERSTAIDEMYEIIKNSKEKLLNSYGYFVFRIIEFFYFFKSGENNKVEEIIGILDQNLNCLQADEIAIYYSLLGMYYKRNTATNPIALDYFIKSNNICIPSSIVYAMNIFQLISIYAESNQSILAYKTCINSKSLLKYHNNYGRSITVDMFECIVLTDLGLYEDAKEKLLKILQSSMNDHFTYKTDIIYHCLAWNALLNKEYEECIKYTKLARDNEDTSHDLSYFIPLSLYYLKKDQSALDVIKKEESHSSEIYKYFLYAIRARIQEKNDEFETNILAYYQSLLQNNIFEDIPLVQDFILDYYKEIDNSEMMIKILLDMKSLSDNDLTIQSSALLN